jgi:hypothetical protein
VLCAAPQQLLGLKGTVDFWTERQAESGVSGVLRAEKGMYIPLYMSVRCR